MAVLWFLLPLLTVCYATESHLSTSNLTFPCPHIIIVGPETTGKSSLAMAMLGGEVTCNNCTFPICPEGMDNCTNTTTYATSHWLGIDNVIF